MAAEPFLARFACAVSVPKPPRLAYDPHARRNRVHVDGPFALADVANGTYLTETREQKDHAEHVSLDVEGTIITATSESKDQVEDDRILCTALTPRANAEALVGTKKSGGDEQTDPADDRAWTETSRPRFHDRLLTIAAGTKKTDSREQSDPADEMTHADPACLPDRGHRRIG